MTACAYSPVNGGRPVTISYSTDPSAQTSARPSTATPRACSGAMYVTVPRVAPVRVSAVCPASLAKPKSRIFMVPSVVRIRFAGLMSR